MDPKVREVLVQMAAREVRWIVVQQRVRELYNKTVSRRTVFNWASKVKNQAPSAQHTASTTTAVRYISCFLGCIAAVIVNSFPSPALFPHIFQFFGRICNVQACFLFWHITN